MQTAIPAALVDAVAARPIPPVRIANEVGLGIVPEIALAQRFRDKAGWLNQQLARLVDEIVLVSAGLPLSLEAPASPIQAR